MEDRDVPRDRQTEQYVEDIITALERELDTARHLTRQHSDTMRRSHRADEQVLIERRRHPR